MSKLRDWSLIFLVVAAVTWPVHGAAQGPLQPPPPTQIPQQAPLPPKPTAPPPAEPQVAITVNVPIVTVDAVVTDDNGNYLQQLKKQNFRVTEDGVPQVLASFGTGDEPLTVVIIVEYSQNGYGWYLYDAEQWSAVFLNQLKPVDWVALESFNIRTNLEVDFTHDKTQIIQGLISLGFPISLESNVYDAVVETEDKMHDASAARRPSCCLLPGGTPSAG